MSNMNKTLDFLREHLNSEKGKKSLQEYANNLAKELNDKLKYHFELSLLTDEQFENLLYTEFALHTDEYSQSCYKEGYEPYVMPSLQSIYSVMLTYGIDVPVIGDDMFVSETKLYKGIVIQEYQGQGCFYRIYKNTDCIFQF